MSLKVKLDGAAGLHIYVVPVRVRWPNGQSAGQCDMYVPADRVRNLSRFDANGMPQLMAYR